MLCAAGQPQFVPLPLRCGTRQCAATAHQGDICCYGSAILDPRGTVAGCISVSMPTYRFAEKDQVTTLALIQNCVSQIQQRLI
ncbi:TPA: hypothetical protein L9L97_000538 [Klebsiella pneumoniae]|nr:hypothetical protein [Klebsiella pneumoniae]